MSDITLTVIVMKTAMREPFSFFHIVQLQLKSATLSVFQDFLLICIDTVICSIYYVSCHINFVSLVLVTVKVPVLLGTTKLAAYVQSQQLT